jgi:hypothetical protein
MLVHPLWKVMACLSSLFAFASSFAQAQSSYPGWHRKLDVAQREAVKTGKPVFVVFRCTR